MKDFTLTMYDKDERIYDNIDNRVNGEWRRYVFRRINGEIYVGAYKRVGNYPEYWGIGYMKSSELKDIEEVIAKMLNR